MAAYVITNQYLAINAVDWSDDIRSATLTCEVDTPDSTTMSNTWSTMLPGVRSASLQIEFVDDYANSALDDTLWALFGTSTTFEVRPTADAVGTSNPKFTGSIIVNQHSVGGSHGDVAGKSVTYPVTGAVTRAEA